MSDGRALGVGLALAGFLGLLGLLAFGGRGRGEPVPTVPEQAAVGAEDATGEPVTPNDPRPRRKPAMDPMAVGRAADFGSVFAEMDAYLEASGVAFLADGTRWVTARELTKLPKATADMRHAIPPRVYWPNIISALRFVLPIREQVGPLELRAYRPDWYNTAVGGASDKKWWQKSTHLWFAALDVYTHAGAESRRLLAHLAAQRFKEWGDVSVGLGIYGAVTPSNIHVDVGWKRRTWRDTKKWL